MVLTPSIGTTLASRKGVGAGFDVLRVALALSVIGWHSIYITQGVDTVATTPFYWFPGYAILSMFFGLSGFLITASAMRLSLANFVINRALRIVPALFVEVILSAVVLGAALTTLPLSEYFQRYEFWRYFGNVAGLVTMTLPGVFGNNPADSVVNGSLWTIPFEIGCYILMTNLILSKCLHRRKLVLALCVAFVIIGMGIYLTEPIKPEISSALRSVFVGDGSRLFISFLLGIAAYLYRFETAYSHGAALASLLLCLALAAMGPLSHALLNVFAAPILVYLTIYVGVTDLPKPPLFRKGDYSYGLYLYGYPLQQTCVALLPLRGNALLLDLVSLPLIIGFAMLSWHAIEYPILKLRRRRSFSVGMRVKAEVARQFR